MTISSVPLTILAANSARELEPRIDTFSAEMVNTRALGQRLVAAGSASSPDAAAQQVLGVVAVIARSADEAQAKSFAVQMGQCLVRVAEAGWNTAQSLSEFRRFSLDFSSAASPFHPPAKRRTLAPVCGA